MIGSAHDVTHPNVTRCDYYSRCARPERRDGPSCRVLPSPLLLGVLGSGVLGSEILAPVPIPHLPPYWLHGHALPIQYQHPQTLKTPRSVPGILNTDWYTFATFVAWHHYRCAPLPLGFRSRSGPCAGTVTHVQTHRNHIPRPGSRCVGRLKAYLRGFDVTMY